MRPLSREVIAADGKALRESRQSDGAGALHLASVYATCAGLVLAGIELMHTIRKNQPQTGSKLRTAQHFNAHAA